VRQAALNSLAHIAALTPHPAQPLEANHMSHNIGTLRDGRSSFAFRGDRNDIWHRLGNQHDPAWSTDDWAKHSGLDFEAIKGQAYVDIEALGLRDYTGQSHNGFIGMKKVESRHFLVRNDNGYVLSPGAITDRYQIVQPREVLNWFEQYVAVDPRFQLDTAGALHGGELIFATAQFNGDLDVVGSKHKARLLMTTTFDGTGSTINRGCMTRVVCNNTLNAAMLEKDGGIVRTRHNTEFNPKAVGAELARIAQGFATYKAMGEAMAQQHLSKADVSNFFKCALDIDLKETWEKVSTRKKNQFEKMFDCYHVGVRRENLEPDTGWSALQAVTRFADHERSVKNGSDNAEEVRFSSSVIDSTGNGALMKQKAVFLLNDLSDGALLRAVEAATVVAKKTVSDKDDFADLLKAPFKPSRG
jgi:phage/plasmid-like protein (TIGR03299 family)